MYDLYKHTVEIIIFTAKRHSLAYFCNTPNSWTIPVCLYTYNNIFRVCLSAFFVVANAWFFDYCNELRLLDNYYSSPYNHIQVYLNVWVKWIQYLWLHHQFLTLGSSSACEQEIGMLAIAVKLVYTTQFL